MLAPKKGWGNSATLAFWPRPFVFVQFFTYTVFGVRSTCPSRAVAAARED